MGMTKVDTSIVAEGMREEIRRDVQLVPGVRPRLVGFLCADRRLQSFDDARDFATNCRNRRKPVANKDPAARKYAEWTGRAATKDGIEYELREVEACELGAALHAANKDDTVHGILIYYPKDVEGLCTTYRHNLYRNIRRVDRWRRSIVPCTPLAVVKCLEHVGVHKRDGGGMAGVVCSVVNRSEIVGRPLAAMLANDGATVYSIDIDSIYVMRKGEMAPCKLSPEEAIKASDVVVLGVPSPKYKLKVATLKKGAVVVNVSGFKNLDDSDATDDDVYTYIPLVGRVTVACLERSLVCLYKQYHVPKLRLKKALRWLPVALAAAAALVAVAMKKRA
ncbi:methenyltetrahydrofolate cyclohydrolase [Aureococcus anophagefferens]|nr:methenyltetrahydrofolate cyclohydrolase [Aureococcus anophagefferens]